MTSLPDNDRTRDALFSFLLMRRALERSDGPMSRRVVAVTDKVIRLLCEYLYTEDDARRALIHADVLGAQEEAKSLYEELQ